jgi:hypothetical protein
VESRAQKRQVQGSAPPVQGFTLREIQAFAFEVPCFCRIEFQCARRIILMTEVGCYSAGSSSSGLHGSAGTQGACLSETAAGQADDAPLQCTRVMRMTAQAMIPLKESPPGKNRFSAVMPVSGRVQGGEDGDTIGKIRRVDLYLRRSGSSGPGKVVEKGAWWIGAVAGSDCICRGGSWRSPYRVRMAGGCPHDQGFPGRRAIRRLVRLKLATESGR